MNDTEQRLEQLEIRLAYQEDLIGSLNDTVSALQKQLDLQQGQLRLLWQQLQESQRAEGGRRLLDEIPPHY